MKSLILAATLALVPLSTPAWASGAGERGAHFEGKPSATLAQAVANFNEYNLKLKAILDGKLTGVVTSFDNFCVLLRRDGHSQLVYKHAISTIMPGQPLQMFESEEAAS